jgi:dihydrofolate synthase / folylpolyglutamate synthase
MSDSTASSGGTAGQGGQQDAEHGGQQGSGHGGGPRTANAAELAALEAKLNQRWPETKIDPSLDRIATLVDVLGSPQRSYPVLHVAGTNGKTSTVRMIDALLTALGLRTGRYTSPHLQSVTERIGLDGEPVSVRRYLDTYQDIEPYVGMVDKRSAERGEPALSKFEVLTAMAFAAFADAPVEVAAVEVGLGGSWDATNVADGTVSVITPIGIDHVEYLGTEITGIAAEKAGIIKPGSIAVLAAQSPQVAPVLLARCAEVEATVAREGMEFGVLSREFAVGGQRLKLQGLGGVYDEILLPLHGAHQASNAAVALATVEAFLGVGTSRQLDLEVIQQAFASVTSPGRLERLDTAPPVFADAAHNPHGARALAATLREELGFRRIVVMISTMRDKDTRGILAELEPVTDELVVTQNTSPRALDVDELATVAVEVFGNDRVAIEPVFHEAIETAVWLANDHPLKHIPRNIRSCVVITGSVVTAGEARAFHGKVPA